MISEKQINNARTTTKKKKTQSTIDLDTSAIQSHFAFIGFLRFNVSGKQLEGKVWEVYGSFTRTEETTPNFQSCLDHRIHIYGLHQHPQILWNIVVSQKFQKINFVFNNTISQHSIGHQSL
jgi:hypothetical protein